jgi:hypothetical protein
MSFVIAGPATLTAEGWKPGSGAVETDRTNSATWRSFFEHNARNLLSLPWHRGAEWTPEQRDVLAPSLQDFQLGESSEGRRLLEAARGYAVRTGDAEYVEALRLFIGEEQRHAADLGRFLRLAGVPLLRRSWTDAVFRRLRCGGLEPTLCVLLTAELIAMVYYLAVHDASPSPLLRRLCAQILRDERRHLRFHTERLAILRRDRNRWQWAAAAGLQRLLFAGTCLVVWWKHGRALRLGSFGMRRFWRQAWRECNQALRQVAQGLRGE